MASSAMWGTFCQIHQRACRRARASPRPRSRTRAGTGHRPTAFSAGPLWHGNQRASRASAGAPALPRARAPMMTSFAWQQASTLSARSCRSMMGRCGPRRARTSSSLCRPTSRKSPAARAACASARGPSLAAGAPRGTGRLLGRPGLTPSPEGSRLAHRGCIACPLLQNEFWSSQGRASPKEAGRLCAVHS